MEVVPLYAVMFLGLLIQTALSAQKFLADGTYSLSYWFKRNVINFLIGLGCGIFLVYARNEVMWQIGFQPIDGARSFLIYSFTAGYLGREWIYQIVQARKNISKTEKKS